MRPALFVNIPIVRIKDVGLTIVTGQGLLVVSDDATGYAGCDDAPAAASGRPPGAAAGRKFPVARVVYRLEHNRRHMAALLRGAEYNLLVQIPVGEINESQRNFEFRRVVRYTDALLRGFDWSLLRQSQLRRHKHRHEKCR